MSAARAPGRSQADPNPLAGPLVPSSAGGDATEAWREAVDLQRLAAWMDAQGLGTGAITGAVALTGGTQNILVRFERAGGTYVLRRPPAAVRPESAKSIAREARVLAALAGSGLPHPAFIAACADAQVLGAPFYLMAPVTGFNASAAPLTGAHAEDASWQRRMGFSVVDALLRLGELDHRSIGLRDFGRPEGFLERQVPRWRSQFEGYRDQPGWPGAAGLPGVEALGAWLEANRPATFTPGILHGDFHLSNVMFANDAPEVAAVIDWELATIGDPLLDLGWLVATWPDATGKGAGTISVTPWHSFPTAAELIEHYRARSRRDLSSLDWYVVLASYKLGILLEGSYARACAGKAPQALGEKHHASALRLFANAQRVVAG